LQELYLAHKDKGFTVLAFPCNQFGKQEPGSNEEILEFARTNYNATFPIFSKIRVNGPEADPIYKFLRSKLLGTLGTAIKWNFTKFLVDKNGLPFKRYSPATDPKSIEPDILNLLQKI